MCMPVNADDWTARIILFLMLEIHAPLFMLRSISIVDACMLTYVCVFVHISTLVKGITNGLLAVCDMVFV